MPSADRLTSRRQRRDGRHKTDRCLRKGHLLTEKRKTDQVFSDKERRRQAQFPQVAHTASQLDSHKEKERERFVAIWRRLFMRHECSDERVHSFARAFLRKERKTYTHKLSSSFIKPGSLVNNSCTQLRFSL